MNSAWVLVMQGLCHAVKASYQTGAIAYAQGSPADAFASRSAARQTCRSDHRGTLMCGRMLLDHESFQ